MMHLETLRIDARDGQVVITDEEEIGTFYGETVAEAMAKAATYVQAVYDARKCLTSSAAPRP